MRRWVIVVGLFAALCCTAVAPAGATELGGGAYPLGAEGIMAGAVPPPGLYFINYLTWYSADSFRDGNGDSVIPGFKLDAWVDVFRFLKVTDKKVLGGNWAMHAFIPVVNLDVTMPPGISDGNFGIGDIIVDPFILSWHSPCWHFATGIDCYLPTGDFSATQLANIGRNYWTFEPILGITYLNPSGFEVSAKLMYDFNTKNSDMDYQSGQEFHIDYAVAQHLQNNWTLGLAGYCYWQMTDDEYAGVSVPPDGMKGKVFAAGPTVKYDRDRFSFIFTYTKEFGAENKPEGQKAWFKCIVPF